MRSQRRGGEQFSELRPSMPGSDNHVEYLTCNLKVSYISSYLKDSKMRTARSYGPPGKDHNHGILLVMICFVTTTDTLPGHPLAENPSQELSFDRALHEPELVSATYLTGFGERHPIGVPASGWASSQSHVHGQALFVFARSFSSSVCQSTRKSQSILTGIVTIASLPEVARPRCCGQRMRKQIEIASHLFVQINKQTPGATLTRFLTCAFTKRASDRSSSSTGM